MSNSTNKKLGFATRQIHEGSLKIPGIGPLAMPIFQTSTFVFDNAAQGAKRFACEEEGYIYTRLGNPNANQLAKKIANLEGGEAAIIASSGIGAITTAIYSLVEGGDHIVADTTLYGCTLAYLKHGLSKFGVESTFADLSDINNLRKSIKPNTKVVYFETPCNPTLKIIDIKATADEVHKINPEIKVVVDNTFCTPYIQRPLELGADVVVHSATKYLNGHGDVIAGVVVGSAEYITKCTLFGMKDMTGAVIGPFEAFLINRGMKTLNIRMERHCQNAQVIAEFLESDSHVKNVIFPGLKSHPSYEIAKKQMKLPGGMICFELDATREQTEQFINSLELCTLAVSLGDAETLIEHPASMTHSPLSDEELAEANLTPTMVRISAGLEDPEDIIDDIKSAFVKVFGK